ncbi:uncharacterized protein LTR77_001447 [Saxophila tyrrhenica]|uniref:Uncharacterized protein n=1 Tax=Saxophila tyrrhenica TaxID=1690608 RepID=A0AAV9PPX6_9PEZI|nr:hypothetical protein LTR77_001447 [Saxophila tyrrhenica]
MTKFVEEAQHADNHKTEGKSARQQQAIKQDGQQQLDFLPIFDDRSIGVPFVTKEIESDAPFSQWLKKRMANEENPQLSKFLPLVDDRSIGAPFVIKPSLSVWLEKRRAREEAMEDGQPWG